VSQNRGRNVVSGVQGYVGVRARRCRGRRSGQRSAVAAGGRGDGERIKADGRNAASRDQ
jgi:hypothetical protein